MEKGSSCLLLPFGVRFAESTGNAWRGYSPVDVAMLSRLDLEGIPRGTGSGSRSAGRRELPDLGIDI